MDHVGNLPFPGAIGANFKDGYMFVTGHAGLAVHRVRIVVARGGIRARRAVSARRL